jgi:hypothetical protein
MSDGKEEKRIQEDENERKDSVRQREQTVTRGGPTFY